ncbi:MAG: tRNA 2-thiouridine(34) synthase MnmA [Peptostreptococcaceae bacterium]|nr:tRNA 2-thiouridine(34) synthase MnmA [Peptostreptococcaceae bacterium]
METLNDNKVVIGLSGGVDSATAALLLLNKGYDVHALYLIVKKNDTEHEEANKIAEKLGICIKVLDVSDDFDEKVIKYFIDRHNEGMVPSPCIVCNREIKFKYLLDEANKIGAKYIATGHYAQIIELDGKKYVGMSKNRHKDQSYMLANLTVEQVNRLILPLEKFSDKESIREIAKDIDRDVSNKRDSQELCFVSPDITHIDYLKTRGVDIKSGKYVDKNGNVLGSNPGYQSYTIGQRKRLNIALGKRMFVTKIDSSKNEVTLGTNDELFIKKAFTRHNNIIVNHGEFDVKIRSSSGTVKGKIVNYSKENDLLEIEFSEPVRAVTPGQFLVIYKDDVVMGIGEICNDTTI